MGPAEKQIHVSNSLGAKVKADFLFHLYLYFSIVPISFSLRSIDSPRRDMLFASSSLPDDLSLPPPWFVLNTLSGPNKAGWHHFIAKSLPHGGDQGPHMHRHVPPNPLLDSFKRK